MKKVSNLYRRTLKRSTNSMRHNHGTCADPESFFSRVDPSLTTFFVVLFVDEGIQISLKAGHHQSDSDPLAYQ